MTKQIEAKSVSKKEIKQNYSESFDDLESRSVYHDPLGARTAKGSFSLKPQFYENDKEWFDAFNQIQKERRPPNLRQAINQTNDEMR